ncbi:MAG: alpha/beta hydrolase [Calothrix sp. C42_A2020_038]|nr:alpha/beta hydrolase [Calothrix sp. C42_A2020_038]
MKRGSRLQKLLVGEFSWTRLIRSSAIIYLLFGTFVYFRADSMIFLPQPSTYQDTQEIIKLNSPDGVILSALHLPNPTAKYTILYAHGNAEDLGDIRQVLEELNKLGFSVFAYDYRGYGTSQGTPSEQNTYKDIDTAYNYLTQVLKLAPQQIIVYGRSVGGGSAVDLAARKPIAGLILESTFTSAFRVRVPFPILPFDRFSNIDKIDDIKSPVLIMHGKEDNVVPFYHSQQLFEKAPSPKMNLWVEGANHNNFVDVAGNRYGKTLQEFIRLIEDKE